MNNIFIDQIKTFLKPYHYDSLKRYGGNYDGGYILAENLLDESNIVYSYGVGPDESWISFDRHMISLNKQVYMYDNLSNGFWTNHDLLFFKSEYVNSNNIYQHILDNKHSSNTNMILKMDIEGNEFETLLNCDNKLFNHFNQITIEFHDMVNSHLEPENIIHCEDMEQRWHNKIKLLDKINQRYSLVHIHGNNNSYKIIENLPDVLELLYIRNDYMPINKKISKLSCPINGLDYPNDPKKSDIFMDWWLK